MSEEDLRVRQLAYRIWESEGRPSGQDQRHWDMALKIVEAERGSGNLTPVDELPLDNLSQEAAPMEDRGASDYARPEPPTAPAQVPVSPFGSESVAQDEESAEPAPQAAPEAESESPPKAKRKPRTTAPKSKTSGAKSNGKITGEKAASKKSTAAKPVKSPAKASSRKPKGSSE